MSATAKLHSTLNSFLSLIIPIIKVNLRPFQLACSPIPVAILFLLMSLLYAGTSWGQTKASNWSALADKANAQESIRIIVQLTEDTADGSDLSSAQGWEPDQCWRLRRRLQQRFLDPQYHNKYRGLGATAKQQRLVGGGFDQPQLRSRFHLALQ